MARSRLHTFKQLLLFAGVILTSTLIPIAPVLHGGQRFFSAKSCACDSYFPCHVKKLALLLLAGLTLSNHHVDGSNMGLEYIHFSHVFKNGVNRKLFVWKHEFCTTVGHFQHVSLVKTSLE